MKLLNLDQLVKPKRAVTLNGTEYLLIEQSVGQMISAIEISRMSSAADESDALKVFNQMVEMAGMVLKDCPDAVIRKMSMGQLSALLEFAMASDDVAAEGAEVDASTEGDEEKK